LVSGTGVFNPAIDVSGTYYYYITDGCFLDSAAIEVTVSNGSTFSIGNDTTFCNATSFEIIPDVTDPDATYLWSTGSTDPTITVLVSGTYGVTVTIGDCESSAEIEVNFFSSTLDLGNDLSLCPGESTTLNADIGLPGTTYLWNTGATDPQITVADTGTYSVVVTNGSCQVEDDISIDFFTSSLDLGNDVEICNGDSLLLDADIGLAGATYTWSTGESTPQIYVSTAGNFSVSVVNGSCQEVDDIDISIINIDLELGNDVSICPNDSVLLDATVTDLTADYVWSTGATSPQIYASFEGIFSVTVTVGNCTVTDQVNVQEVSFTAPLGNDIQLCPGDSALLNADLGIADVTYLWSTGETSPQIYVDAAGNYSVVISNGDCDFQDDILVSISNGSEIPVNLGADQTICEGENIVLNSGYTTANYQHLWSDGSSGASITVSSAGIYFVNLSNSCQSGSDTIEIFIEDCDTIIGPIDTTNFEPPCQILFPTAFSPNNDGFNDQFGPVNICPEIESVSFRVYNRFGQEVFSGINTSWDGTFKNEIVPLDNFVWYATYLYSDGSIKDAHGNVVIVK
jgi:gliding motility-associated-like protein